MADAPKRHATQALDLLNDLLEEEEQASLAEAQRLEEELRQRKLEEQQKAEEADRRRREDAERRLQEEEERRRAAAERRSAAEEAARLAQMTDEELAALQPQKEDKQATIAVPVVEKKSSAGPIALAAILLGAIGVGGFFGYQELTREHVDTQATYPMATPTINSLASAGATARVQFQGPPAPEPEADTSSSSSSRSRSSGSRSSGSGSSSSGSPSSIQLGGMIRGRN